MVNPIFLDLNLQTQFDRDGFVKITLLSQENVDELNELFKRYFPKPSSDFFSSSYENDYELKNEISNAIGHIMLPQLQTVFKDFTWFGSAFLSKGNGPRSEMPMHQDWTIVDEQKFVALNIWTPLQDTDEQNGTLEVLKGSHKWHKELRAPTLPFYFEGFQNQLKPHLTPLPTRATEAIVLNQAVIHYSKANQTNQTRVAITTGIKSKNAPMVFHYWDKEQADKIEQFSQMDDFLLHFKDFHQSIFKRPVIGESIGVMDFKLKKANQNDLDVLLPKNKDLTKSPPTTNSLLSRISKWLKA